MDPLLKDSGLQLSRIPNEYFYIYNLMVFLVLNYLFSPMQLHV